MAKSSHGPDATGVRRALWGRTAVIDQTGARQVVVSMGAAEGTSISVCFTQQGIEPRLKPLVAVKVEQQSTFRVGFEPGSRDIVSARQVTGVTSSDLQLFDYSKRSPHTSIPSSHCREYAARSAGKRTRSLPDERRRAAPGRSPKDCIGMLAPEPLTLTLRRCRRSGDRGPVRSTRGVTRGTGGVLRCRAHQDRAAGAGPAAQREQRTRN